MEWINNTIKDYVSNQGYEYINDADINELADIYKDDFLIEGRKTEQEMINDLEKWLETDTCAETFFKDKEETYLYGHDRFQDGYDSAMDNSDLYTDKDDER